MPESGSPPRRHVIPTHLSTPERIIGPFTARALLLVLLGCAVGYSWWLRSGLWFQGLPGGWHLALRLTGALLPPLLALMLGLGQVAGRPLDAWCVIVLLALRRPRRALWCSVSLQDRAALPAEALQEPPEALEQADPEEHDDTREEEVL